MHKILFKYIIFDYNFTKFIFNWKNYFFINVDYFNF